MKIFLVQLFRNGGSIFKLFIVVIEVIVFLNSFSIVNGY